MAENDDLISKAEVARLLELSRSTITMWQRRYTDFPSPAAGGDVELFQVGQLLDWLTNRVVPADVRRPDEAAGDTYANRFRRSLGLTDPRVQTVQERAEHVVEKLVAIRDRLPARRRHLDFVLTLLYVSRRHPDEWRRILQAADPSAGEGARAETVPPAIQRAFRVLAVVYGDRGAQRLLDTGSPVRGPDLTALVHIVDAAQRDEVASTVFGLLIDRWARESDVAVGLVTPTSVARLMIRLLGPARDGARVHDPYCRTGELLAAVVAAAGETGTVSSLEVTGAHPSWSARRLAQMRLDLLGVSSADTGRELVNDRSTESEPCDLIVANPPFNSREGPPLPEASWRFGEPPRGNANLAWLQYAVTRLGPGGRAAVLMANNASFSDHPQERSIRQTLIVNGTVEGVIALPGNLFNGTSIQTTLWLLGPPGRSKDSVVFVDARGLGTMASGMDRFLSAEDMAAIVDAYRGGRTDGQPARASGVTVPGRKVTVAEIRDQDYSLSPPTYIEEPVAGLPGIDTVHALTAQLGELASRAAEIDAEVAGMIRRVEP